MRLREFQLSCGASLSAITTDRFKTSCLTASTAVRADAVRSPLATLAIGVPGHGTVRHPSLLRLNEEMDALYDLTLYARNYRMGDLQILGSGAYFIDPRYLPPAEDKRRVERENVRMLAESLYAPLRDAEGLLLHAYVEREKKVQCDAIRDEKNHPSAYAEQRSRELTFSGEPHGVSLYGTVDGVSSVTREELTRYCDSLLPHARIRFFYVGSEDGERVAELLENEFLNPSGKPVTDGATPIAVPTGAMTAPKTPLVFEEALPVPQSKLVLTLSAGVDLSSDALYAAAVYNELLGASPQSRLFLNVRERKSLCYHCSSLFDSYKGYFSIAAGIRRDRREETEEAIRAEIGALSAGDVTEDEVENAKRYLSSLYTSLYDSASSIEHYYFSRRLYGLSETPEETRERIARVTLDDVVAYAARVSPVSTYFLDGTGGGDPEEESDA